MTYSMLVQRRKEVKLSQTSLIIVFGWCLMKSIVFLFIIFPVFMLCHGIKWIPNIWELLHAGDLQMPWPRTIRKGIVILIKNQAQFSLTLLFPLISSSILS